ncbi:MAG: hypothetical protein NTV34_01790 [Proteobacteria bacterium]|nr:hypothetical protein [Pseudomonadota bacterium]
MLNKFLVLLSCAVFLQNCKSIAVRSGDSASLASGNTKDDKIIVGSIKCVDAKRENSFEFMQKGFELRTLDEGIRYVGGSTYVGKIDDQYQASFRLRDAARGKEYSESVNWSAPAERRRELSMIEELKEAARGSGIIGYSVASGKLDDPVQILSDGTTIFTSYRYEILVQAKNLDESLNQSSIKAKFEKIKTVVKEKTPSHPTPTSEVLRTAVDFKCDVRGIVVKRPL